MARLTDQKQPPPSSSPALRPTRPPADPALQQRVWAGLMLAIISLLAMMMIGNVRRGVYVVAVALLIAATALWLSISAMRRARRDGSGRPRAAVFAVVLGVIGFGFSAFVLAGFAMFWPQITQFSNCMNGANTVSAQQACQQQLDNSVSGEIGILGS